jgi:hypothetical protein
MNSRVLAIISWAAFIALIVRIGWTSHIFENRIVNMAYEAGFMLAGAAIVISAFIMLGKLLPKRSGVLPWLLISALIAGAAYAKSRMDDDFDTRKIVLTFQDVKLPR